MEAGATLHLCRIRTEIGADSPSLLSFSAHVLAKPRAYPLQLSQLAMLSITVHPFAAHVQPCTFTASSLHGVESYDPGFDARD